MTATSPTTPGDSRRCTAGPRFRPRTSPALWHGRSQPHAGSALVRQPAGRRPPPADTLAVLPGPQPVRERHDKNSGLINLHLATGQLGKPGAGPFSLTGQPNAMGGREVGGMANLLSAHPPRQRGPSRRGRPCGASDVPPQPGKTAVELFEAADGARSRRSGSPARTPHIRSPTRRRAPRPRRCEFVVVQEARHHRRLRLRRLMLPATAWGERTDRHQHRASHQPRPPAVAGPGESAQMGDRLRVRAPPGSAARVAAP